MIEEEGVFALLDCQCSKMAAAVEVEEEEEVEVERERERVFVLGAVRPTCLIAHTPNIDGKEPTEREREEGGKGHVCKELLRARALFPPKAKEEENGKGGF